MGWFPNNNHPRDKATFDFHLTAPSAYDAIGNGELASKVVNGRQDDLELAHGLSDGQLSLDVDVGLFDDAPLRAGADRGRQERSAAPVLRLHRERAHGHPEDQQQHERRTPGRDRQVHGRHDRRAVPVRLARRRRGPRAQRRPTRSRSRPSRTSAAATSASARSRTRSRTSGSATASARRRGARSGSTKAGRPGGRRTGRTSRTAARPRTPRSSIRSTPQPGAMGPRRPPTWGPPGALHHDARLQPTRGDARGLPPDRRRHGVLRLPEGARDRARARPHHRRPVRRAGQAHRRREGGLRGVQPHQARHVLPAVAVRDGQADAQPDDVLPEHERPG